MRLICFRLHGANCIEFNSFKHPVTTLDKLHAKHALPGFADRSAEEREIEAATTDITKVRHGTPLLLARR